MVKRNTYKCWRYVCDICKQEVETEGTTHFRTKEDALDCKEDFEFHFGYGGKILCSECAYKMEKAE